jgi:hypothetical protein
MAGGDACTGTVRVRCMHPCTMKENGDPAGTGSAELLMGEFLVQGSNVPSAVTRDDR